MSKIKCPKCNSKDVKLKGYMIFFYPIEVKYLIGVIEPDTSLGKIILKKLEDVLYEDE